MLVLQHLFRTGPLPQGCKGVDERQSHKLVQGLACELFFFCSFLFFFNVKNLYPGAQLQSGA
jgi:hypothetical protein